MTALTLYQCTYHLFFLNLLDSLDLTLRIAASTGKRELPRSSILSSCHSKSFGNQEISWRDSRFQPQEPQTKPETETTKGLSTRGKEIKHKVHFFISLTRYYQNRLLRNVFSLIV